MSLLTDHVLFIDGEALILDKPAGLPVDAPRDGSIALADLRAQGVNPADLAAALRGKCFPVGIRLASA